MYSGEEPPSFSPAPITTTPQEQLPALGTSIDNPIIAQVDSRSLNPFQNEQPPSVGSMRPIIVSQPGSNQIYTPGQGPPSLNDVGRRGGSQAGVLPSDNPIPDPEEFNGMSMTAGTFRMFNHDVYGQ